MIDRRTFQLPGRAVALVLAGGRGSRLHELTDRRAKPAVYFGGKYRIVDFAMSNCVNSGIRRVGVVTQYKSHSLLRHLQRGWGFLRGEVNEFVTTIAAAIEEQSAVTRELASNIADATEGVHDANTRATQMSGASKAIAEDIAGVDAVATDIHSGCRHLQDSVQDLTALAEQLEKMVGQFKV